MNDKNYNNHRSYVMNKLFFALFIVSVFCLFSSCDKLSKPPTMYEELLSYKGTNKNLYKYLMRISVEDEQLFRKLSASINLYEFELKANPPKNKKMIARAGLLYIFNTYYNCFRNSYTNYYIELRKSSDENSKFAGNNKEYYENTILDIRNVKENWVLAYADKYGVKIKKTDLDTLTDFFLNYPFE